MTAYNASEAERLSDEELAHLEKCARHDASAVHAGCVLVDPGVMLSIVAELRVVRDQLDAARGEIERLSRRTFPVMGKRRIPWALVEPFRDQAKDNHDQTLERLAERGGLSSGELWCVVHAKDLRSMPALEWSDAWFDKWIVEHDAARGEIERLRKAAAEDHEEIEELHEALGEPNQRSGSTFAAVRTDRDRLAAEVERVRLTAEEREALGELSAAWSRRTWIEGVEWSEIQLAIAALNRLLTTTETP